MKVLINIAKLGAFFKKKLRVYLVKGITKERYQSASMFLKNLVFLQFYKSQILQATFQFSFLSLSVIFLTALCTGAVLTLQTYSGLGFFANADSVARVVVPAVIRELGPVLTGLMIAGRISSSFAAEIATMKTMEQLNALKTLSINPIKYLVLPRVFVGVLLMPVLLIIANVIAILGSYSIVILKFDVTGNSYISAINTYFSMSDFKVGMIKALFFGFIITVVGCFKGMNSSGNSAGVGVATTEAVVFASILILFTNYLLTLTFF